MKKVKKEELAAYTQEELIQLVDNLQVDLKRKREIIYQLRIKLAAAKSKINVMKGRVDFQRKDYHR